MRRFISECSIFLSWIYRLSLKNYHKMIKELMSDKVPNLPNYENFMKASNKSNVFILTFMNFLIEMNRKKEVNLQKGGTDSK